MEYKMVNVRMTLEEAEKLKKNASDRGMAISSFIRHVAVYNVKEDN